MSAEGERWRREYVQEHIESDASRVSMPTVRQSDEFQESSMSSTASNVDKNAQTEK